MKLIIGLGNPGEKYQMTRHNAGLMLLDDVVKNSQDFKTNKRFQCQILKRGRLVFIRPRVYMNNSGLMVGRLVNHFKANLADLWIFHDDLDLKLGDYKIQKAKGPKDHKGLISIESVLGKKGFWRVRIGIDNRKLDSKISGEKYVLQNFSTEELQILKSLFQDIAGQLNYHWL
jgi:PTH1 family peptidyl-tRNA hydrolase